MLRGAADSVPPSDAQLLRPTLISPTSAATPETGVTDVAHQSSAPEPGSATSTPQDGTAAPAGRSARLRAQLTRRRASDSPLIAVALAEYLRVVQELARRIVTSRQTPPAATPEGGDTGMPDATLHETLQNVTV